MFRRGPCDERGKSLRHAQLEAQPERSGFDPSDGHFSKRADETGWKQGGRRVWLWVFTNLRETVYDVSLACAVVGRFHIAQYRVNPLPPAAHPTLERRDLALSEEWIPVSSNIENLQLQYAQGMSELYEDEPSLVPMGRDPESFITRVRVSVSGRSASTNLRGGSPGVFAAEDTHLRKTFATTVSLRNQLGQAQQKAIDLGLDGWN